MLYSLNHTTAYEYSGPVSLSHHLLRLQPRNLPGQRCLKHELRIEPRPGVIHARTDYFGNETAFVTIEGAHRKLTVHSESRVYVGGSKPPAAEVTPAWEKVRDLCAQAKTGETLAAQEFIYASPQIRNLPGLAEFAAPSFAAGRPVLAAALDLTARIHRDFKFDVKATNVATPLEEFLKNRRGVCQDFAHLEIGCLRAMGIPARYVSGYLETQPPPGKPRLAGADASHAWVSFYCPAVGWLDLDPTNNLMPTNRHITIAWGRDYSDVSPVRGVLLGSGEHALKVAVDVVPLEEDPDGEKFDFN